MCEFKIKDHVQPFHTSLIRMSFSDAKIFLSICAVAGHKVHCITVRTNLGGGE